MNSRGRGYVAWDSCGQLVELAADEHAADFLRARPDFVELGVAQQAACRVFVDVAVAAQRLDGLEAHLRGPIGSKQNGSRGILACAAACIAGASDGVRVGA